MGTHRAVPPGRRRAIRPPRSTLLQRLVSIPAIPTVPGIFAMAVAGTGAIALDRPASAGAYSRTQLTGTDAIGFTSQRALAISRDSERQALADAAQAKLLAATEQ